MHYRSWVFLALFGLAGVSSAEEAKPAQARPAPADPPTPCGDSSTLDGGLGKGRYSRKKCSPQRDEVYIPPEGGTPVERLSASDIMAVVLAHKPAIIKCVKAQKAEEPDRTGRLDMSWGIRRNGSTRDVKCTTPELCKTVLASCLTREIKEWSFPRHKVEGDPTVFPFTF